MPTIQASIQLYNGMTPALKSMSNALNIVISSMESMQRISHKAVDTTSLQAARGELAQVNAQFMQMDGLIQQAANRQQQFNNQVRQGKTESGGLIGNIKNMVGAYAGLYGLKQTLGISDELARTTARIKLMTGEEGNAKAVMDSIYVSSQRTRTSYMGTADAVAKLGLRAGSIFKSSNETIAFVEQLNKQFKIAGASQMEIASSTLQLTQALGSGVLRGEEFNAVFEAAPNVMQTVADYMGQPIGKMRDLAANGQVTAEIVKNAMFAASAKTNAAFESIPMTWADVWTTSINTVIKICTPLLSFINILANNWSILRPIILGVVAVLGLYAGAMLASKVASMAHLAINTLQTIALAMKTKATIADAAATKGVTVAQWALNSAMYACPLTWIIIAIIAIIAIIYAVVAAINKWTGTTVSATGVIIGAFMWLLALLGNILMAVVNFIAGSIVDIINFIITLAEFLANVFIDPIGSICRLFAGMADYVLGVLETIAKVCDTIFGSNVASTISGWRSSLKNWSEEKFGAPKIQLDRLNKDDYMQDRFSMTGAYNYGYNIGQGLDNKLGGMFESPLGGSVPGDIANTADNTGKMADSVDMSGEDLKYLRDLAERDTINRFTTAQIKVDQTNNNHIASDLDLDGIMNKWTKDFTGIMDVAAEGVHV